MIILEKIDFFYNEQRKIFSNFSLTLEAHNKYWIQGKNGSGKTTLLKILLGILKVKKGNTILKYNKHKILFLPSTPFIEPFMPLNMFISFYLNKMLNIKVPKEKINLIIKELDLTKHKTTLCKDLSKGTIQKIIISPLFINYKWEGIFMDEPFEHLDMDTCMTLSKKIANFDGFIIIINHKEYLLDSISSFNKVVL